MCPDVLEWSHGLIALRGPDSPTVRKSEANVIHRIIIALTVTISLTGCGGQKARERALASEQKAIEAQERAKAASRKQQAETEKAKETPASGEKPKLRVTSPAFENGKLIPKKFTGEGDDVSPELAWTDLPEGTKEIVMIVDDPDAPIAEPWVHWVIYGIPATNTGLKEGVAKKEKLDDGTIQGKNSWPEIGYGGPMPPPGDGPHRYFFKVYAVSQKTGLEPGATKKEVLKAIEGNVLASGVLMGTYERK